MTTYSLSLAVLAALVAGAFAGYSFPVKAENIAIVTFKKVNPSMEIDGTNFLADLSGLYSKCQPGGARKNGRLTVTQQTPEGRPVYGLISTVSAHASDSDSLTTYIDATLKRWTREEPFRSQIQSSNFHGCSIQPDCPGELAVIVCLFSDQ